MKKTLILLSFVCAVAVHFSHAQCTPFIQAVPNTIFPCQGGCNGKLVINPIYINGTPPYTFVSSAGTVVPDQPNPGWTTIYNLCAGQVFVDIADAAGCTGSDMVTIVEAPAVNPVITVTPSCGSLNNGSVTISNLPDWFWQRTILIRNSAGWYAFTGGFNQGDVAPLVVNNLVPGDYTFEMLYQYTYDLDPYYGCDQSFPFTITSAPLPSATVTPAGSTTFCNGSSVVLQAPAGANKSYQWKKGVNLIAGATSSTYEATTGGNYRVTVTNTTTGCAKTSSAATVVTVNASPAATITPQGPTTFCTGSNVLLKGNNGTGLTYQWKRGGTNIAGATLKNYTATTAGIYKVKVTGTNGCSKLSTGVTVSVPCRDNETVNASRNFDFTIYPNPNKGAFTLKFSNTSLPVSVEMVDAVGRVVKKFTTNYETVEINELNLAKGIYYVKAQTPDDMLVKKISIER